MAMTRKTKNQIDAVARWIKEQKYPPSCAEIGKHFGKTGRWANIRQNQALEMGLITSKHTLSKGRPPLEY